MRIDPLTVTPVLPRSISAALRMLIDRKMTQPQAKRLVEWVKAGNEPSTYGLTGVATSQTDPIGSAPRNDSGSNRAKEHTQVETKDPVQPTSIPVSKTNGADSKQSYVIQGIKNAAGLFRDQFISGMSKYMAKALAGAAWVLGFWFLAMIISRIWFTTPSFTTPQVVALPQAQAVSAPIQPTQEMATPVQTPSAPSTVTSASAEVKAVSVPTPAEEDLGAPKVAVAKPASAPKRQVEEHALSVPISKKQEIGAKSDSPTPVPTAQKPNEDVVGDTVKKVVPDVADKVLKDLF